MEDGMSVKSEDELGKLLAKRVKKKYEPILSALNEKERDLEKSVENLEEELVARRFKVKIHAKQDKIAQLAKRKVALESKLKKLENKSMIDGEVVKQTEETNLFPIVVNPPKLNSEARTRKNNDNRERFDSARSFENDTAESKNHSSRDRR